jgi:AbrB family transcriptional regulator, transcriptional pleiotropic regulator of transition state genes
MKATGIIRKIDELGRIVLPKELRRTLNISKEDEIEIFVSEGDIHLRKFAPFCIFCSETQNIVNFKDKNVCENCINILSKDVLKDESENEVEINKLRQVLSYKNREVNTLKLELSELQQNINQYKNNDNAEKEIGEYKSRVNMLNTELFSKEGRIEKLQKTIKVQEESIENFNAEIGKLYETIKNLEESIGKYKEERVQLEKDLKILEQQGKIDILEKQINNIESERSSFISRLFRK